MNPFNPFLKAVPVGPAVLHLYEHTAEGFVKFGKSFGYDAVFAKSSPGVWAGHWFLDRTVSLGRRDDPEPPADSLCAHVTMQVGPETYLYWIFSFDASLWCNGVELTFGPGDIYQDEMTMLHHPLIREKEDA